MLGFDPEVPLTIRKSWPASSIKLSMSDRILTLLHSHSRFWLRISIVTFVARLGWGGGILGGTSQASVAPTRIFAFAPRLAWSRRLGWTCAWQAQPDRLKQIRFFLRHDCPRVKHDLIIHNPGDHRWAGGT